MITERLQHLIDVLKDLPPEEQDRVAAAVQVVLEQPSVTSDSVRPTVRAAFEQVMEHSGDALDYLGERAGTSAIRRG